MGHNWQNCPKLPQEDPSNPEYLGTLSNIQYIGGPGNEIAQTETKCQKQEVSLTKGMCVIFDIRTTGFSKKFHHIIKFSAEVFAPDRNRFNNGNFHSVV